MVSLKCVVCVYKGSSPARTKMCCVLVVCVCVHVCTMKSKQLNINMTTNLVSMLNSFSVISLSLENIHSCGAALRNDWLCLLKRKARHNCVSLKGGIPKSVSVIVRMWVKRLRVLYVIIPGKKIYDKTMKVNTPTIHFITKNLYFIM